MPGTSWVLSQYLSHEREDATNPNTQASHTSGQTRLLTPLFPAKMIITEVSAADEREACPRRGGTCALQGSPSELINPLPSTWSEAIMGALYGGDISGLPSAHSEQ